MSDENGNIATDWRARIKEQGKQAFELDEMRRLGFWPPANPQISLEEAEQKVKDYDRQIAPLQKQLRDLEAQIAKANDVETALDQIRRNRIERVKKEREERRARQAHEREERAATWKEKRATEGHFLGRGVSKGLIFDDANAEKLAAKGLPSLDSFEAIAAAIGIEARELTWLTYHRGASMVDHYHRFQIPKKRGGMRNVSSPKSRLRVAQSWLLETILQPLPIHEAATAFAPGASVVDNASRHMGAQIVVRIDLKDFFPSVDFARVRRLFRSYGFSSGASSVFALLATEAPRLEVTLDGQKQHVAVGERVLPQGACTSPTLTNLLCRRLDARLEGLAKSFGFTFSRYADDLVFSSQNADADVKKLIGLACKIIEDENFVINREKTSVMRPQARQVVTGLVVNAQDASSPRPSRRDVRKFRAFCHHFEREGRDAMTQRLGRDALAYARGMVNWIAMSDPQRAAKLKAAYSWLG